MAEIMYTVNISPKGQITLPAKIRKRLGLKSHDKVALIFRGDELILKPLRGTIRDFRGALKPRQKPENFQAVTEEVKKVMAHKQAEED
ncbi:MAG: AbrB/MazE/SpoVT family DNA-binding domain-containing protein [Ignavibacteria bacterium]|nr:MAG: AbrB/MazE/SpoVT family DNA-binding domain-containing protein [Ignavibacteria bacterium]